MIPSAMFGLSMFSRSGVHLPSHCLLVLVVFAHVLVRQQVADHVAYLRFVQAFRLVQVHTAVLLSGTLVAGDVVWPDSSAV